MTGRNRAGGTHDEDPAPGGSGSVATREILLLFDVDGTLVQGTRTHEEAIQVALRETFLVPPGPREPLVHGQTDIEIAMVRMKHAGIEPVEVWNRVEEYARRTSETYASRVQPSEIVVLPGVPETLRSVRASGYSIGLLTGNVQAVAWKKMELAELREFFPFGAFGDDAPERAHQVSVAHTRLERDFGVVAERTILIGDAVSDVRAARRAEVEVIALTTGLTSEAELRAEGAGTVLSSMRELPAFLEQWRAAGLPSLQPR